MTTKYKITALASSNQSKYQINCRAHLSKLWKKSYLEKSTEVYIKIISQTIKTGVRSRTLHKKCFPLRICLRISLSNLRIWSQLLKKSLMENFIFCAVEVDHSFRNYNEEQILKINCLYTD